MATYKVIQDIEAEDKLIGPLTFRQFVYAGVAALCGYLSFLTITKHAGFLAAIFIPFGGICAFFAWPFAGDQPTEVWALAKVRFYVKPRRRIWNQSGVKELVTITAPKKVERAYTNGLSQNEVQSRLHALANTIDSRGWAIKNVNVNMYAQHSLIDNAGSDRLIDLSSMPQAVPSIDIRASDDMLDEQNNPIAQQFDNMIAASTKAHRQQIIDRLRQSAAMTQAQQQQAMHPQQAAGKRHTPQAAVLPGKAPSQPKPPASNYWFLNQPTQPGLSTPQDAVTFNAQVVAPGTSVTSLPTQSANPTPDEEAFMRQLAMSQSGDDVNAYAHLHTIQPLSQQDQTQSQTAPGNPTQQSQQVAQPQVTQPPDAAILDLARNDDLNVATIAREAHKRTEPPEEVVISLH